MCVGFRPAPTLVDPSDSQVLEQGGNPPDSQVLEQYRSVGFAPPLLQHVGGCGRCCWNVEGGVEGAVGQQGGWKGVWKVLLEPSGSPARI